MRTLVTLALVLAVGDARVAAAQSRDSPSRPLSRNDPLIAWASTWGDAGGTGVYTCEEWKRYAAKLFKDADKNHDGFLDPQEFKTIQQADKILKSADFAYFDDNKDGRVSRAEFIEKPNPLFARYDYKSECKVSLDAIVNGPGSKSGKDDARSRR
jgi:hypothetical protein